MTVDWTSVELDATTDEAAAPDLCMLASELARDNVCSLLCAPDQIAQRLIDDGSSGGRCYQLRCELRDVTVHVGVCLP